MGQSNHPEREEVDTAVKQQLGVFAAMVLKMANNNEVNGLIQGAPQELTRGRNLMQIVMDDAMEVFEHMALICAEGDKDYDNSSPPLTIYKQLMSQREAMNPRQARPISDKDALNQLQQRVAEKRAANDYEPPETPVFLDLLAEYLTPEYRGQVVRNWASTVANLGQTFLVREGRTAAVAAQYIKERLMKDFAIENNLGEKPGQPRPGQGSSTGKPGMDPALDMYLTAFGEDLTAQARAKPAAKIVGREDEVKSTLSALLRRNASFAMTVGKAGAGKSTVTQKLIQQINDGKVPADLKDASVIRIKLREMRAESGTGQKQDPRTREVGHVDQFVDRLGTILTKTAEHNAKGGKQIILNLDEFAEVFAGKGMASTQSLKDLLTAKMRLPSLRILAEINEDRRSGLQTDVPEVMDRFQETEVKPLSEEQTLEVLKEEAITLGAEDGIYADESVLDSAIKLTKRYIAQTAQPKSAIDTIRSAVAFAKTADEKALTTNHLAEVLSRKVKIPKEFISASFSDRINELDEVLPKIILGQPAVKEIAMSLKVANAGLGNPNKPFGSFLMIGPTGTGKTETGKALAQKLGVPMIRIDMANFQDQHAKAKLIGAPPGYVGYNDKPELEKVADSPYCVLVLDEIEKAHGDVFNVLLSVLNEAEVQLMNGRTVDFRNCIILMTSNLGTKAAARELERSTVGPTQAEDRVAKSEAAMRQEVEERLPPEFIGRLSAVLTYKNLTPEVVRGISMQQVNKVSGFLREKNRHLSLELSPQAMDELQELGFNAKYGARPMEKAVEKYISLPLSAWFIDNAKSITEPTVVYVNTIKDKFDFVVRPKNSNDNAPAPAAAPAPAPRQAPRPGLG